jgi:hypothetical protein
MNLDLNTFGNTPAALYLVEVLNQIGDQSLSRKLGKRLSSVRKICHEIRKAQLADALEVSTVSHLTKLLRIETIYNFQDLLEDLGDDDFDNCNLAINLAQNLCMAEFKMLVRASTFARKQDRGDIQRAANFMKRKITPPPVNKHYLDLFVDTITPATLQEKSRAKLLRTGKRSELY